MNLTVILTISSTLQYNSTPKLLKVLFALIHSAINAASRGAIIKQIQPSFQLCES